MNEKPYHIERKGNTVVLGTKSFRTERRSVLHSGVFNRELASSLAAGAVIVAISFFFALYSKITALYLVAVVLLFAALFILFRLYVFREATLETVFDLEKGTVSISLKRALGGRSETYPLAALSGIRLDRVCIEPENIDAVRLVERVAVQHGTVIPGFGKTEDFYTVELDFGEKRAVVFSARERQDAEAAATELKGSLSELPFLVPLFAASDDSPGRGKQG
jgi:Ca2+/Na+ antiporter